MSTTGAGGGDVDDVLAEVVRRRHELNAFVHLDVEQVRRELATAVPGPLTGRLVAVKDNIAVRGAPWAAGSATRLDLAPPDADAEVVRRVRAAGGVVLGTTNLDELAMGASTETSVHGPTRNPHDPTRTAGGSSGGAAAAVAAHGVLGIGTDTGGSIREPASMCGVVGVVPSPGTVPTHGVLDFAPSMDRVGPLATTVAEAAQLHEVMAGVTGLQHAAAAGRRQRLDAHVIGVVTPMSGARNAPEVVRVFEHGCDRLRALGATLVPLSVPRLGELLDVYATITSVEALPVLTAHAARGRLGAEAESRRRAALELVGSSTHRAALVVREQIRADVAGAFTRCEVMLSPTVPLVAPLLGRPGMSDPLARPRTDWWTVEANLAGVPAASVPAGTDADGLPIGVQLMAPPGQDRLLYRFGAALETVTALR